MRNTFNRDFLASVVVFLVALPLCMGIAIASGLDPLAGILTGIIGGIVVGALSGSPLQVSGPAAGLTVLVLQQVQQFGVQTLGVIVLFAGLIQLVAGVCKLGQWFRAVSPAVIQGMLAGIGVLIFASQAHVLMDKKPIGNGVQNLLGIPQALQDTLTQGGTHLHAAGVGLLSIIIMAVWGGFAPKKLKIIPAPLLAVIVAVAVAAILQLNINYVKVPDNFADVLRSVTHIPTTELLLRILEPAVLTGAVAIAFIASAETLLCATAVDQMHRGARTKYDKELVAQGVGNTLCGMIGVLPMTGVIVRSSANVDAGAATRASAIMHGFWLLLFVSIMPFVLRYIPISSLAAVLVYTGYKLAYPKVVPGLLKFGKSEVAIYAITIITIVVTNLLAGVLLGLGLSLLKLLYAFSHLRIRTLHSANNKVDLHLHGAATLIMLPKLAAQLEVLSANADVHVHIEELNYIDHACIDLLSNWRKQHESSGGKLTIEWENLENKFHQRRRQYRQA